MKTWHWLVVIALGLMIVGSSLFQYWSRPEHGDMAPEVSVVGMDGERVRLSEYRGSVVLLHFWATWCGPCREEFPDLEAFNQKMQGKPFALLAVSEDGEGAKTAVEGFSKHVKFSFPIYIDEHGSAADAYHASGVPESILIDSTGKIVSRFTGPQDWADPELLGLFKKLFSQLEGK